MSKDVTGKILTIGDDVSFCQPRYSVLHIGRVKKITPKGANY